MPAAAAMAALAAAFGCLREVAGQSRSGLFAGTGGLAATLRFARGQRSCLAVRARSYVSTWSCVCGWCIPRPGRRYASLAALYGNSSYLQWTGVGSSMVSIQYVENSSFADQLRQSEPPQKVCVCTRRGPRSCPRKWNQLWHIYLTGAPGNTAVRPRDNFWANS
ncbi:LAFE_0B10044g1_1 [Lachancea fermentati]|uniref:LAFE_0B10044g1_1 n=1 Tax=Lachancea fermentati TaxID=4955 RepID=A0A1G4M8E8_LACFM|nr:LAFE_0B10044g1_1 [Lachancea fermentati]